MREFKEVFNSENNGQKDTADFYHANSELGSSNVQLFAKIIDAYSEAKKTEQPYFKDRFPGSKKIKLLPLKKFAFPINFYKLLFKRRSVRKFGVKAISLKEISKLLQLSYGKIKVEDNYFSTIPSAGGIYPLHLYLFSLETELENGIYHHYFFNDFLDEVKTVSDLDRKISELVMIMNLESLPALYLCITADFEEVAAKYGERGYRFALIETGHLAQNIMLVAESMGLSTVSLGGYFDKPLSRILGIHYRDEKPLYVIAVGKS